MKVLVGCEMFGHVRDAFRKLGHQAYSCDVVPDKKGSRYHIQEDVLKVIGRGWELAIFHPPCTFLANSGVKHLHLDETRWKKMEAGAKFFRKLLRADIPKIAVENPIMHKYAVEIIGRRQDQVIQPWMFGHTEQKATCLWLKGLPKLVPTKNVKAEMMLLPIEERQRMFFMFPSADRTEKRSETYQGIADAMAQQWGATK